MSLKACRRSSPISWMTRAFACICVRVYRSLRSLLNQHVYMHVCVYTYKYTAHTRANKPAAPLFAGPWWLPQPAGYQLRVLGPGLQSGPPHLSYPQQLPRPVDIHFTRSMKAYMKGENGCCAGLVAHTVLQALVRAQAHMHAFMLISMHFFLGRCNTRTVNTRTNVRRQQDKADPTSDPPCPHCHACRHM